MMSKLAEAYVDILPNLAPLERGLSQAKVRLTGFVGNGNQILSGLRFSVGGGALGGASAIGYGLFKASQMGADFYETVDKVKVTFGTASKDMIDQADDLAARFGTVKKETLDASSAFGLMGKAAGMSDDAAAKLGKTFVQLGLDLASYHNLSNAEAFTKLRAGLAGEAEPLRPLGILLSEDAVKAEALSIGLVKVKRELTDQEKVLARISLIRRQAGPAVGNLESTSGSAANQMRKLHGEIENIITSFGEKLLPALLSTIDGLHQFGSVVKQAFGTEPVDAFAASLKGLADTFRPNKLGMLAMLGVNPGAAMTAMLSPEGVRGPSLADEQAKRVRELAAANEAKAAAANLKAAQDREAIIWKGDRQTEDLARAARNVIGGLLSKKVGDLANDPLARGARVIANDFSKRIEDNQRQLSAPNLEISQLASYQQQQQLESNQIQKEQLKVMESFDKKMDDVKDVLSDMAKNAMKNAGGVFPRWLGG